MKKETAPKKAWKKPEVQDLDVKNTASGTGSFTTEHTHFGTIYHGSSS